MTDDLVQRLRSIETSPSGWSTLWFAEAADEIERLRKLVATFKETAAELLRKGADQADEIVRLQAELEAKAADYSQWVDEFEVAHTAEVERLQQALRDLLRLVEARSSHEPSGGVVAAARAVLNGDQQ